MGLHAIVGLAIAAALTWAFFAIADEFPEKGGMVRVDLAVTTWLQVHGSERGETFWSAVSLLGSPVLYVLAAVATGLFIFRRDWRHLIVLAVAYGGGTVLNTVLKVVFHRARPTFASEFVTGSWSFPSGHAMGSLIMYGLLAFWTARRFPHTRVFVTVATTLLVLAIGFSRIYLGVHYPSDVLAGYCAGSAWLTACITAYRFTERRHVGAAGADESKN